MVTRQPNRTVKFNVVGGVSERWVLGVGALVTEKIRIAGISNCVSGKTRSRCMPRPVDYLSPLAFEMAWSLDRRRFGRSVHRNIAEGVLSEIDPGIHPAPLPRPRLARRSVSGYHACREANQLSKMISKFSITTRQTRETASKPDRISGTAGSVRTEALIINESNMIYERSPDHP